MAENCIYRLGEFHADEFHHDEFFVGFKDCSISSTGIDCNRLLIHAKPYVQSQREIDYHLLFDYVNDELMSNYNSVLFKLKIGKDITNELQLGKQTKYLIEYLLLFKEELKVNPTIDNYLTLFNKYAIECTNKHFRLTFDKPSWVKDMLKLLNISTLVNLPENVYQLKTDLDLDPIYYIANI